MVSANHKEVAVQCCRPLSFGEPQCEADWGYANRCLSRFPSLPFMAVFYFCQIASQAITGKYNTTSLLLASNPVLDRQMEISAGSSDFLLSA